MGEKKNPKNPKNTNAQAYNLTKIENKWIN